MSPRLAGLLVPSIVLGSIGQVLATPIRYVDVADRAGLVHVFPNGGESSKAWILETTGSGAVFLDYDGDGHQDAFLVSGESGSNRLYRNTGNGHFEGVTAHVGLLSDGWGQGACVGDLDNDGYTDLFVTYWGPNRLYRNLRGTRFEQVTVPDSGSYSTGCAFLDADRDGDLDLFVATYLEFDFSTTPEPGANPYCFYRDTPVACGPRGLPFSANELLRNDDGQGFTDVSAASRISSPSRNDSLGAVTGDFNGEGWTDICVACE